MKSDQIMKAFVTFRVAGETLAPDHITQLLRIHPTYTHKRGEAYSTGRSNIIPTSGIWIFRTDTIWLSTDLNDHIRLLLLLFGLPNNIGAVRPIDGDNPLLRLAVFLHQNPSLSATMSFFWHGAPDATEPKIPEWFLDLLKLIPVAVEIDFDRDESVSPHGVRAA
jgi:hypothetical protein